MPARKPTKKTAKKTTRKTPAPPKAQAPPTKGTPLVGFRLHAVLALALVAVLLVIIVTAFT